MDAAALAGGPRRTAFTPWRYGTTPAWRRTSGPGPGRTPCGGCSCGSCGPGGTAPLGMRSGRPLLRGPVRPGGFGPPGSGVGRAMKRILLIGTGGTIASEVAESGLAAGADHRPPARRTSPPLPPSAQVDCLQLSQPGQHQPAAAALGWPIAQLPSRSGTPPTTALFITHGTDTMAYTAAGTQLSHPAEPQAHRAHRRPEAHRL